MDSADPTYDIAIAGGGLVGVSAALLLAQSRPDWRVALIDPEPAAPQKRTLRPSFDARTSALSAGSIDCLTALGCWEPLAPHAGPIQRVHVSDRGYLPGQLLEAPAYGRESLGCVVPNESLGEVLLGALQCQGKVTTVTASVTQMQFTDAYVELSLGDANRLKANLLVVADGANSPCRQRLGITVSRNEYAQNALVANVQVSKVHQQVAYERFTDEGPLALLPLADPHQLALVWTLPPARAEALINDDEAAFLNELQARFGYRLGRFIAVGRRSTYPLSRCEANEQVRSRLVLVGNAAHSLHPVAGQGFNLALRDCQQLAASVQAESDPGQLSTLLAYQQLRDRDQRITSGLADTMVRMFSQKKLGAVTLRHLGLLGLEALPPLKTAFGRQMMGLTGLKQPVREGGNGE